MLQRSDDAWKTQRPRDLSDQVTPLLAINVIIVLVLVVLALSVPSASDWISAAAEAEFIGGVAPTVTPTQIARPLDEIKIVRTN